MERVQSGGAAEHDADDRLDVQRDQRDQREQRHQRDLCDGELRRGRGDLACEVRRVPYPGGPELP